MYSYNINTCLYNNYNTVKSVRTDNISNNSETKISNSSFASNPLITQVPFNPAFAASKLRTELSSKDEKNKYNELTKILDKDSKKLLNNLLKTGALLNSESNDNSTTLDNLYKIATTPRAQGLNNITITCVFFSLSSFILLNKLFKNSILAKPPLLILMLIQSFYY